MDIKIKGYRVVSIDIFDTLLIRMTENSDEIFYKLFKRLKENESWGEGYTVDELVLLRKEAQNKCYEEKISIGKSEYYIEEIYKFFPVFLGKPFWLVEQEIEEEVINTYINPDILKLIKEGRNYGCRIVLTSDMYMSQEQLQYILKCAGLELSLIDAFYISCDKEVSKVGGGLFRLVIKEEEVGEDEIIHIGDNPIADIQGASLAGIKSVLYKWDNFVVPELVLEMLARGDKNALYKIRYLSAMNLNERYDDFWYREGFLIWGPILVAYAEDILNYAEEQQIGQILPIMREGVLIEKVLKLVAKSRKNDVQIKRMYCSRNTTALACYDGLNRELFDYFINQPIATLEGFFSFMGVKSGPFNSKRNMTLSEVCRTGLKEDILSYLMKEENKKEISDKCKNQRDKLLKYLMSNFDCNSSFICCDIGYVGTAFTSIDYVLHKAGYHAKREARLLFSSIYSVANVLKGARIHGFVQEFAKDEDSYARYFYFIESLFMGEEGTVRYYKEDSNSSVIPVLEKTMTDEEEYPIRNRFHQGVIDFVKEYISMSIPSNYLYKKKEFDSILSRLFRCPSLEEAKYYLDLKCEQNIGKNELPDKRIYYPQNNEKLTSEAFLEKYRPQLPWAEACLATTDFPFLFINNISANKNEEIIKYDGVIALCRRIIQNNISEVITFGAGIIGKRVLGFLRMYGIRILGVVDNNPKLWGLEIMPGVKVFSMKDLSMINCGDFVIAVRDKNIQEELLFMIREKCDNREINVWRYV